MEITDKNNVLNHDRVQGENFLQSAEWRKFQESVGHKAHFIESETPASSAGKFSASIVEHELPIVGKYFYVPRGPLTEFDSAVESNSGLSLGMQSLIDLAKKENAGWIRIEPHDSQALDLIRSASRVANWRVAKAPHDMQPKEVFVLDISKDAEQLLAEMKSKTRYNIGVAQKKGVIVSQNPKPIAQNLKYVEAFLRLTKEMAARQGIAAHPEGYYKKMIESLPSDMLKIYVAEYEDKIIAANLVVFFDDTATYLHGASSNDSRNVMAPYLLQWQAILDAKEKGCVKYDFGGIKLTNADQGGLIRKNNWAGITQFKVGFSPNTQPVVFPGSYDIIINPRKYGVYRGLQRAKAMLRKIIQNH